MEILEGGWFYFNLFHLYFIYFLQSDPLSFAKWTNSALQRARWSRWYEMHRDACIFTMIVLNHSDDFILRIISFRSHYGKWRCSEVRNGQKWSESHLVKISGISMYFRSIRSSFFFFEWLSEVRTCFWLPPSMAGRTRFPWSVPDRSSPWSKSCQEARVDLC